MMRMRMSRPELTMNVFTLFLLTLTALFYLSPVQDAAPENPVECNLDGDVKFTNNNAGFEHIPGDAVGLIVVCEDRIWKNIFLCEEEWTRENTVVACRQLGYAAAGSFVVDSSAVIEERRRLSYKPQCTEMEERLANCTQNYTQPEDDGGRRVVISCWNSSRDSSQPTFSVTHTHTLALQTSTITSTATVPSSVLLPTSAVAATVPSSVLPRTVPTSPVSDSKVPSSTPYVYIPTNPATDATSDTRGQLVLVGVAGVVTADALVLVVVAVVCTVWRNRRDNGRSVDECEAREMELNPAYQTTASLTSSMTDPAYQTTASLASSMTNSAYQTTASLISTTTNPAYAGLPVNTTSPHLYEDVFHCQRL